jgi:hypothetical protein
MDDMAKRNYKPEEIGTKLQQVEVLQAQGIKVVAAIKVGVTSVTYYC